MKRESRCSRSPSESLAEKVKEENHEVHLSKAEDEFLKTPLHDTGSIWYKVLSFFFPIIGIIAAMVYKKKQYYHNYKACKQGALYGFAVLAVILLIFIIALYWLSYSRL